MDQQGCICVFAKPPQAGRVKTRLIPLVGSVGAAALAEAFLQDTLTTLRSLTWAKAVIASTNPLRPAIVPPKAEVWLQGNGDLGARLERILNRALRLYPSAFAMGADSPGLPGKFLEEARVSLETADAVIGPCEDGGFYLLGLRRCPTGLFTGIPWSDGSTCAKTVARLKAAGMKVHLLSGWFDVDRPQDLVRLRGMIATGEVHIPRTQEALERAQKTKAPLCAPDAEAPEVPKAGVSVIIPVLNERDQLPASLAQLRSHSWIHEVIVVDGASSDGTRQWLEAQTGVMVVDAPAGRGSQLNVGARAASGDLLLFLHADSFLPPDAGQQLANILTSPYVAGGCFGVRFASRRPRSLSIVAAGINLRTRITRTATGDQGIFVRPRVFEKIEGFREWPLFEDVDLVSRVKREGAFVMIPSPVTISPRRHLQRGVFRSVLLVYALRLGFWVGLSPLTLARWYQDPGAELKAPGVLGGATENNFISM